MGEPAKADEHRDSNGENGNGKPAPGQLFPDYRRTVALKYVSRGLQVAFSYISLTMLATPFVVFGSLELFNLYRQGELQKLVEVAKQTEMTFDMITVMGCIAMMVVGLLLYFFLRKNPVYLVDFSVFRANDSSWNATYKRFMNGSFMTRRFTEDSLNFQKKILERSGLGQDTMLPPAMQTMCSLDWKTLELSHDPAQTLASVAPRPGMKLAREEFEVVIFSTVQDLLNKTGVRAKDIGILVVNCSLFNPTPSLCAMVINHFKMRSNIISYNLSGMGCSASPIAIDLANQMLQLYSGTYALVISTENITQNWYFGNDRSMLLPNCLFRVGGAAMLLSNRRRDGLRAKYELQHVVRTHLGAKDQAYGCIFQTEDDEDNVGVRLTKELMAVAGEALKVNVTTLGPLVLPISEQALFIFNLIVRKTFNKKLKPYIPDFKLAFDKICIHTGGRAVIDEIEKQLRLTPEMVEPSRAVLFRYGNVSSSSIWYVLAYMESIEGVKRGDRIWQLGFGSGFKCNSAVWRSKRRIKNMHYAWEGFNLQEMRDHLASLAIHKARHLEQKPK
mmetsp:Transcript_7761/g.20671  ORF Transcript_7761/g.20671 Transcript_7761/m.20671 type:complete len:559 (-) Transcript_7761:702-2378(-)|eukprot:CAMPEP_0202352106 /NCGR_PEP_ID=MMETSP1126-20121109/8442_1 /ASSEMBLY_ACC=CAM_ASM_000457 /TAXON_ID=3047 /ORGANISM="Dunaliella tertiolecta, Strain CCMP1320" /LENGTH=558 /DNA_ID=CAMNT_0048944273 /DNA_START=89 /DNA_END=1765 /DNA_ORIENTATION=-